MLNLTSLRHTSTLPTRDVALCLKCANTGRSPRGRRRPIDRLAHLVDARRAHRLLRLMETENRFDRRQAEELDHPPRLFLKVVDDRLICEAGSVRRQCAASKHSPTKKGPR
jgi:hypothetical protein